MSNNSLDMNADHRPLLQTDFDLGCSKRFFGTITYRKMFGEYAIYSDDKLVVLVCDDQVFVKPTEKGRAFIGNVVEAPPYLEAKLHFLI